MDSDTNLVNWRFFFFLPRVSRLFFSCLSVDPRDKPEIGHTIIPPVIPLASHKMNSCCRVISLLYVCLYACMYVSVAQLGDSLRGKNEVRSCNFRTLKDMQRVCLVETDSHGVF